MLNQEELLALSEEEFVEAYKAALGKMSFHNAADGPMWTLEKEARGLASSHLSDVVKVAKQRGIERPEGQWLC